LAVTGVEACTLPIYVGGRKVYVNAQRQPAYMEEGGRIVAISGSASGNVAFAGSWDRDGDGVANNYDRYPDDYRYR